MENDNVITSYSSGHLMNLDDQITKQLKGLIFCSEEYEDSRDYNNIYPRDISEICHKINEMDNLEQLKLQFYLSDVVENATALSEVLKKLDRLQILELNFRFNKELSKESLNEIGIGLSYQKNLKVFILDLYNCGLVTDDHIKVVAQEISQFTSLEELTLQLGWNSKITCSSIQYIASCIKPHQYLKKLDIWFHYCQSIKSIEQFANVLGDLVELKELQLSFGGCYEIPPNQFIRLFENIKNLQKLEYFYLDTYQLQLNDEIFSNLSISLKYLQHLSSIHLSIGNLKITDLSLLSRSLGNLTQLNKLILELNYSGELSKGILRNHYQNLQNLEYLEICLVGCYNVKQESVYEFIPTLSKLTNLKELTLNLQSVNNSLSTDCIINLSQAIKNLTRVNVLQLSFQSLTLEAYISIYDTVRLLDKLLTLSLMQSASSFQLLDPQIRKKAQSYFFKVLRLINLTQQ